MSGDVVARATQVHEALPPAPNGFHWLTHVVERDDKLTAEFGLAADGAQPGDRMAAYARIDLELYGIAGVKERAAALVAKVTKS
ncbi:hypothetical protein [Mycolicibacterium llatzerense]|uniref:hypothetical protein n=1 Tax=Mycolicibacterium llatzerense TaxID=280871 RepID=UPI0021B6A680|nr:hypothetical protein [Mycolicibacterium llatzerense]MCT7373199.1 hypothetical protein [Mycolicibacterium llatzerense]